MPGLVACLGGIETGRPEVQGQSQLHEILSQTKGRRGRKEGGRLVSKYPPGGHGDYQVSLLLSLPWETRGSFVHFRD